MRRPGGNQRLHCRAALGEALRVLIAGVLTGLLCSSAAYAAEPAASFKILKLEGNTVSWQRPDHGQGLVITYSLATEAVEFSGARNCRKMAPVEGIEAASGLAGSAVRQEIAAAFAMWEAVANITFREGADPATADILIGAQMEPVGWAFADVFYDALSTQRVKPISKALICLNPAKRWKIGFDGDVSTYDLRYTIAHEIGHAIGLDHPNGPGQIMGYRYEERFRQLQAGDVQGAMLIYGGREPAGATASAGAGPRRIQPLDVMPNVGEPEPSSRVLPELGLNRSGGLLWVAGSCCGWSGFPCQ